MQKRKPLFAQFKYVGHDLEITSFVNTPISLYHFRPIAQDFVAVFAAVAVKGLKQLNFINKMWMI